MLVSYLPLLFSALVFSQQITFTARNIYRLALPLFVGNIFNGITACVSARPSINASSSAQ
ncbi:putative permease [Escherichia coli]|uniref:Putative permease n=1 Tax=Escherichia coli TaxID=562 RepID=A0A2X3K2G3_ECOLX|nr:putative permease [Escherichia coli]